MLCERGGDSSELYLRCACVFLYAQQEKRSIEKGGKNALPLCLPFAISTRFCFRSSSAFFYLSEKNKEKKKRERESDALAGSIAEVGSENGGSR